MIIASHASISGTGLGITGKADQRPIRLPPACRLHSGRVAVNIGIIVAVLAVGWPSKERASA
jgi:hypothetical protein